MAYFRASSTADNTGGVTYQTPTAAHPPYLTVTGDGARAVSRRRRREPTREDEFEGRGRGDLAPLGSESRGFSALFTCKPFFRLEAALTKARCMTQTTKRYEQ